MRNCKILFIHGYAQIKDIYNYNEDIHVVFETGEVYYGLLITVKNIQTFIDNGDSYFWSTNMLIIENFLKRTVEKAIEDTIRDGYFFSIFEKIGTLNSHYEKFTYKTLTDMNDSIEDNLDLD